MDIRYAIGASLVSVIATSSGAAAAYVKEGFSNIRIGMFLEIATTWARSPALFLPPYFRVTAIAVVFGVVLLYSAYHRSQAVTRALGPGQDAGPLATLLNWTAPILRRARSGELSRAAACPWASD